MDKRKSLPPSRCLLREQMSQTWTTQEEHTQILSMLSTTREQANEGKEEEVGTLLKYFYLQHNSKGETTHENLTLWREFPSCRPRSHTPVSAHLNSCCQEVWLPFNTYSFGELIHQRLYLPPCRWPSPLGTSLWLSTFSHAWGISMICPAVTSNSYCPKLFITSHTDLPSALLFLSADLKFLCCWTDVWLPRGGGVGWDGLGICR